MSNDRFEFDPVKNAVNREKHGIELDDFRGFDEEILVRPNDRRDYGEPRFSAFGIVDGRPSMSYSRRAATACV